MKILDRYIVKNFAVGYGIAFCVLIGLRIIIDLFVNLDEFAEHAALGAAAVVRNIVIFYSLQSTLYFRDFAGMITVVAATFSLGKMIRSGELIAVVASGISLKRVLAPVVFFALVLTGVLVIDEEFIIPRLADRLVRSHDELPGAERYDVWFMADGNGSLLCSSDFNVASGTLYKPTIILRTRTGTIRWQVTGRITADQATYNYQLHRWDLKNGLLWQTSLTGADLPVSQLVAYYKSDILPREIPIRRTVKHLPLLGFRQLTQLAKQRTQIKDLALLNSQRHFRITEPVINLIMLLVSLPILACRDPKAMKSAVMLSFAATAGCFITTFVCRMLSAEMVVASIRPELWAWLPVFIYLPTAFIELDSMKT
jgi:lipopolysaccharide export LptBFGC system permease protein LptF